MLLMALKSEGFRINARALAHIWLKLGMRQHINPGQAEEADCVFKKVVQIELDKGHIKGFGC